MSNTLRNSYVQSVHTEAVIRLALNTSSGSGTVWVVTESYEDVRVYGRMLDSTRSRVLPSTDVDNKRSWHNVESIVANIYSFRSQALVFGIRDADYTRFSNPPYVCPPNVLLTEYRDLEMMLLSSTSAVDALSEWNSSFPTNLNIAIDTTRDLGVIRAYNEAYQCGFVFKNHLKAIHALDSTQQHVDPNWKAIYRQKFINNVQGIVTDVLIDAFEADHCPPTLSSFDICRGHDTVKLLSKLMIQSHIYSENAIAAKIYDSYSVSDFKQTSLAADIDSWCASRSIASIII